MNIPKKIDELITILTKKTIDRKVTWVASSRESEFMLELSGSAVTIDSWIIDDQWGSPNKNIDLAIFNSSGVQIERITFSYPSVEYDYLIEFYNLVKKSYLKTDETYKNLIDELDKL